MFKNDQAENKAVIEISGRKQATATRVSEKCKISTTNNQP